MIENIRCNEFISNDYFGYKSMYGDLSIKDEISTILDQYQDTTNQENNKNLRKRRDSCDINNYENKLTITIYMPDITKNKVKLKFSNTSVEIMPDDLSSDYHRVIDLPCKINKKLAIFTYKNGVLDIILEKRGKIKIEKENS